MLAAEPRDVFLNFSLAMEYAKAGRQEEAVTQFGRVIEKTVLAGQRAAIRVRFEEGDEMTLREQV